MSLLFTLMLSVLLVKKREDMRALSPNLLPVSVCYSIDFSDKVQNHFSPLLHRLRLPSLSVSPFISFSLSLSHISGHALHLWLGSHRCLKGCLSPKSCADGAHTAQSTWRCPWDKHTKYIKYPSYVLNIDYFTDVLWKGELGHAWSTLMTNPL